MRSNTMCGLFIAGLLLMSPVAAKEKPQVASDLAPTHGFVYIGFPKGGWSAVQARPVDGGEPINIDTPVAAAPMPGALAFGRWLPAGRYRLGSWEAMKWTNGPEFEVQAGRVTDLGGFVPINIGGYQMVVAPVRHAEDAGDLALATAEIGPLLKNPDPIVVETHVVSQAMTISQPGTGLGLIADLLLAYDRKKNKPSTQEQLKAIGSPVEFLRVARTVVPPLQDEPAILPDGTLYFPSDLGQLRRRGADGEWSNVGIDTLRQILAVEYADGRLVAGSDNGRLRLSEDDGKTWTELKALRSKESIIDIDHADGVWIVTTTEQFLDPKAPRVMGLPSALTPLSVRMRVYTGHSGDFADLTLSREFVLTPKDQLGWMGARGQTFAGDYYLLVPPNLQRMSLSTGAWTQVTPGARIGSHRVDPHTGTLTGLWSQGAFSKIYVSTDRGDHWTQIDRPPYVITDVQMENDVQGWASRWNADAFGGKWEVWSFVPGKSDWAKSGEAPFNCRPMRIAPDRPVICIANDASIFGLHDGEWSVEFSAH